MKHLGPTPTDTHDVIRKTDLDTAVAGKLNGAGTVTISETVPLNSSGNDGDICFVYGS